MSYIRELGPLALASRLKNLSDRLMRDMIRIYKSHHVDFNPRWFTFIHLLSTKGSLSITTIARQLSQTHPAVNQVANALEAKGYIFSSMDRTDSRKRIVALTQNGKLLVQELSPLWEAVENAAIRLIEHASPSFLKELDILEKQLENRSMELRIQQELEGSYTKKLRLIPFKKTLKPHFKLLNTAWLEEYFTVEEEDKRLLDNPETEIIKPGGLIIFATIDEKVIGTGALLHRDNGSAQITKMAIDKSFRGYGFGRRILQYLIKEAEMRGYKKIFLLTSEKLVSAASLYRSAGFVLVPTDPKFQANLSRISIQMEKKLL